MPTSDETTTTSAPGSNAPAIGENGSELDAVLTDWARNARTRRDDPAPGLPRLPATATADPAALSQLRLFHGGDARAGSALATPGDDLLPALLHPFRRPGQVRDDYPLVLLPASTTEDRPCVPLPELLRERLDAIAPKGEPSVLRDNLARLELCVREALGPTQEPTSATNVLATASDALRARLDLAGDSAEQLRGDLARLLETVPAGAQLLPLTSETPLRLLVHAVRRRAASRRDEMLAHATRLRDQLRELLRLERNRGGGEVADSIGTEGAAHLDTDALARLIGPARGGVGMGDDDRVRVEGAITTLDEFLAAEAPPLVHIVRRCGTAPVDPAPGVIDHAATNGSACREAARTFDEMANEHARVFAAMRVARLELDRAYDAAHHDALLDRFDWRAFAPEELAALPLVVALESTDEEGTWLVGLSEVLVSGRPIEVLVTVCAATNPGLAPDADPLGGYRLELGYLGIGHREAFVSQSTAARPMHLAACYDRSLDTVHPSLHVIASGLTADGDVPPLGAWLHGGAALEGRAHPVFRYDPSAGATWARRMDCSDNPEPESDWPSYALPCLDADGAETTIDVAFTFADLALMEPRFSDEFRVAPPEVDDESLVTLDAYLAAPAETMASLVPFLWAAALDGQLHRVVCTRRLAFACRDRQDYWRTLGELAGIRNEYVREAVAQERERMETGFEAEREAMRAAHAEEIARVRAEAAGEVMQRLAASLVRADPAALAAPLVQPSAAPPPPVPAEEAVADATPDAEEAAPAPAPADEDDEPSEPWIESPLCTTCNDCMAINAQVFVYNANKQAVIGDPRGGTFAQIVAAAEKCPARCIHPGTPLDPDEPGLDELIERARPFN